MEEATLYTKKIIKILATSTEYWISEITPIQLLWYIAEPLGCQYIGINTPNHLHEDKQNIDR